MGTAQRGRKARRLQDYPQQGRNPHAENKGRKKIDLKGMHEEDGGKGSGHINLTLGKIYQTQECR